MQHSERPEYTYNYHWGRIILAASLVVGLSIGLLVLAFSGSSEPANQNEIATTEAITEEESIAEATAVEESATEEPAQQAEPSEPAQETVAVVAMDAQPETTPASAAPAAPAAPAEQPAIEVAVEPTEELAPEPTSTPTSEPVIAKTEVKVQRTSDKTSDTRTKAELFTAAIKRAKLTAQVKRREPGEPIPQDLALDPNGLSKVYFYTEVIGQAGKTHYHHWYKNGKLQAKVPITIGSDRWRCYSSKYLTDQQTGEWTVKVKDAKGKLLAQSNFNFNNQ